MTLSLEAKGLLTELMSGTYHRINAEAIQVNHPTLGINRIRKALKELRDAGFLTYDRTRIGSSWTMSINKTSDAKERCEEAIGMVPAQRSGSRQSWDSRLVTVPVKVPELVGSGPRQSWDSFPKNHSRTYPINIELRSSVRCAHTEETLMPMNKWSPDDDFDGMVFGRSDDEDARPKAKSDREKKSRRHRQDRPRAEWNNLDLTYEFRDMLRDKRPMSNTFAITTFAAMLKHLRADAKMTTDEVVSLMGQFFDNPAHYSPGMPPDQVAKAFINFARKNLTRLRSLKVADSDAHANDAVSQESVRNFLLAAEKYMTDEDRELFGEKLEEAKRMREEGR